MANRLKNNTTAKVALGAIALLIVGLLVISSLSRSTSATETVSNRVKVAGAVATHEIDRNFEYPIKDSKGEEISKYTLSLDKAELRDQIIVNGNRATSVEGRTFLVVDLEIKNDYNKSLEITTRDYFRLSMNGNEDTKLAPDVHNDPVEVQAISTKQTRVAFPVNDSDKDFVLHVGEINGNKEKIELNLQYK